MKALPEKWLERLEAASAPHHDEKLPAGKLGRILNAQRLGFALRLGGNAREELDVADASLNPGRRAELTKRLDLARSIASALEKYSPRRETPPSARVIIPGSLDALLAAVI